MSSTKTREKTRRPSWFQDTKNGCEKQTDYFLKIRRLQKELINREQHNLVNAMERLKQLQYPRRKPLIRNFSLPEKVAISAGFPKRSYARRGFQRYNPRDTEKAIKPLKGKHLLPDEDVDVEDEEELASFTLDDIRHIYNRMIPKLNDQQIAKITNEVRSRFPNEPSAYLLQPHLPSIPNVKRKTTTRLVNRLKLLTLSEESEYRTLSVPNIATSLRLQKKENSGASALPEVFEEKKPQNRNKPKNLLHFDIDPNDSSVFVHMASEEVEDVDDFNDGDDDVKDNHASPYPPPNSRPESHMANRSINNDSEHQQALTDTYGVTFVDSKVVESNVDEENISESTVPFAQENFDVNPQDGITTALDDINCEDMPSENVSTDNASQNIAESHLVDICISEPKVIIKTSKTPC